MKPPPTSNYVGAVLLIVISWIAAPVTALIALSFAADGEWRWAAFFAFTSFLNALSLWHQRQR